jgi:dTDP-4-dehydrorhamnose 3,5-epimerase
MKVSQSKIAGLIFLEMEMHADDRGYFARNFCQDSINAANGFSDVSQANISFNKLKGTVRGFHFQMNGHEEAKTVTVYRGALHYKVIDLRKSSSTYLETHSFEMYELSGVLQVPKGCAPAFQTLQDNTLLHYYVSNPYSKENEFGIRYNDPFFNLDWPLPVSSVSERDGSFPDFDVENFPGLQSNLG